VGPPSDSAHGRLGKPGRFGVWSNRHCFSNLRTTNRLHASRYLLWRAGVNAAKMKKSQMSVVKSMLLSSPAWAFYLDLARSTSKPNLGRDIMRRQRQG
jgi:hypothetical protein